MDDVNILPIGLSLIFFGALLLMLFYKCNKCPYDFRTRCDDGYYEEFQVKDVEGGDVRTECKIIGTR